MNISYFIAKRIAFNQQKSFSRFIIRLSVTATIISVMVMILTLAFANGFQVKVAEKVYSFLGNARIQHIFSNAQAATEELPIFTDNSVINQLKSTASIHEVNAFATRYAILKSKEDLEGVLLKGYDSSFNFNTLQPFLKQGRWPNLKDTSYSREIAISQKLASQLQVKSNDKILIYFIKEDGSYRPDKVTITGIFATGIEEYDKAFVIGDIKLIQRLNGWTAQQIGGYEIFLKNYKNVEKQVAHITDSISYPDTWQITNIHKIAPNIFNWLNMQDTTRNVLIIIMIVVAVINLITCLIILVLERVTMVGVLKAIGAKDITVQKIFLIHSLYITFIGIIVGAGAALLLIFIQQKTGFLKLDENLYYLDKVATHITTIEVVAICGITFLVSLLVLLIPTIIVRSVKPVKAIHFK